MVLIFLVDISHLFVAERYFEVSKIQLRATWILPCSLKRAELKHPATVNLGWLWLVQQMSGVEIATQCSLIYKIEVNC
ncbi:unnamed protein product [Citrullus colocynthis]|uniref:Uncharacterized protein n=1 Tax=Citrullus colocynthis TaxID=252529 RepID=A0ABP0XS46_9ROSI